MSEERKEINFYPSLWTVECICGKDYSSAFPESDRCPHCDRWVDNHIKDQQEA